MAQNPLDPQAKLVGLADPVKGKEFPLSGPVKIGRDQKSANVPVVHASVSRQHASVFQEGGVWTVEDLKSTNGVFVNETRTPKAQLRDGDVLRIGDIPFKFELIQAQTIIGAKAVAQPDEALTIPSPRPAIPPTAAAASKLQVPAASRLPASPPPPSVQPAAHAQAPSAPAAPPPPIARPAPPPAVARPAAPPPVARPAAPPPAARPAPPPQAPPLPQKGGEDLFEPSLVGPVNIRATMDAAAKPAPAPRPSARQPEDFEGTMYGGQVAKVLAKEIREEKEVPQEPSPKQKGVVPQVVLPGLPRKPPSFLWLKIKFLVSAVVILGAIGGLLWYGHVVTVKREELQKKYSTVKREVDAFVPRESVSGGDLNDDLAALKRLRELIRKEEPTFQGEKEWMGRLKDRSDKVAFWTFERELKLKIDGKDKAGADKLIDDMDSTCTTKQRRLLPLCKLIVRYELFMKKYPDSPEQATKAPDRKEVSDLCKEDANFSRQWKDYKGDFESEGKQLYELAKHADEIARTLAQRWDRFWTDYSQYKDNKTPEALERLKRDFPHLDILQEKN